MVIGVTGRIYKESFFWKRGNPNSTKPKIYNCTSLIGSPKSGFPNLTNIRLYKLITEIIQEDISGRIKMNRYIVVHTYRGFNILALHDANVDSLSYIITHKDFDQCRFNTVQDAISAIDKRGPFDNAHVFAVLDDGSELWSSSGDHNHLYRIMMELNMGLAKKPDSTNT